MEVCVTVGISLALNLKWIEESCFRWVNQVGTCLLRKDRMMMRWIGLGLKYKWFG